MPTIHRFKGIKINFYFHDHPPPHFHAIYSEFESLIEIDSFNVLQGDLPNKQLKMVKKWAKPRKEELMELWNAFQ